MATCDRCKQPVTDGECGNSNCDAAQGRNPWIAARSRRDQVMNERCHCRMNPDGHVPGWVLDCESGAPDPDGEE